MIKPRASSDDFLNNDKKQVFCDNCGEKLVDKDDKYCNNCGKNFKNNKIPNRNKNVIILISLISIIIIGGYVGYGVYQTNEFNKNYYDYMTNTVIADNNVKSASDVYINEYSSIYAANYIESAAYYNNLAISDLEKCRKHAQTSEEKELIEISLNLSNKKAEFLNSTYNFCKKDSSITYSSDYILHGASSADISQLINYKNNAEKEAKEVVDLKNNLLNFLDNHPDLKKRLNM